MSVKLDGLPVAPVALTIAGSDSGGNAGIQADLRAFQFFGAHGCVAVTALTAQNPSGVAGVMGVPPEFVRRQLDAIFAAYAVASVKTGMLANAGIIRVVADALACHACRACLVVDPVMVATSGARLLETDAVEAMRGLLPLARLATPNLPEAEVLLGTRIRGLDEMTDAAKALHGRLGCAVLLKGGHAAGDGRMEDVLCDAGRCWRVSTPRVLEPLSLHGTGCSLGAAIAASLAKGRNLLDAVCEARAYVYASILGGRKVGETAAVLGTPKELPAGMVEVEEV